MESIKTQVETLTEDARNFNKKECFKCFETFSFI